MSRFFRSGDSSSSSSEDEEDLHAIDRSTKTADIIPAHQTASEQQAVPQLSTELSLVSGSHVSGRPIGQFSQEWTSHHKDVLLHALLEHWSLSESAKASSGDAQAVYRRLVSQLAPLNVLPVDLAHDQHAHTRQGYRDILSFLGQETGAAVPTGSGRILTDGSGDGALPIYNEGSDPASLASPDQQALQAPLRRLLGHNSPQGSITTSGSKILQLDTASTPQYGIAIGHPQSRYQSDFEELSVLGRGGYGIVYQARNRLDNQAYAVKKIPLSPTRLHRIHTRGQVEVDDILLELRTLARLNHPNIVRYHHAWVEWTEAVASQAIGSESSQDAALGAEDTRSGHIRRVFTEDEIDGNDVVFEHSGADALPKSEGSEPTSQGPSGENGGGQLRRRGTRSTVATVSDEDVESIEREPEVSVSIQSTAEGAHFTQSTLAIHIQMSLHPMTLADLLASNGGGGEENYVRHCYHLEPSVGMASAVLDGLEYLHEEGVIHRDIKPANIFLSPSKRRGRRDCIDLRMCSDCKHRRDTTPMELEVCIGDFGLAAVASPETDTFSGNSSPVGTAIYRPTTAEASTSSLDIYALGIVLFELLWKFDTRMERHHIIHELKEGRYPDGFCEWVGRGKGTSVMDCIDCMLAQSGKVNTFAALRDKLSALIALD